MPRSMTGFARQEEQKPWGQIICEIRSVNHRYLEHNIRLSDGLRSIEHILRDTLRKNLGRGKIEVVLAFKVEAQDGLSTDFNENKAKSVVKMAEKINGLMFNPAPVNGLDILNWPGVMEVKELDQKALEVDARSLFNDTLKKMIASRAREGEELAGFIEQRLQGIAEQVVNLKERLPELQKLQQDKIRTKLEALTVDVDEERLAQELVYLAQKSDVAEELDRLEAHLVEIRRTLTQKEPIGRRLDFLMQELNREANTLSSKSTSSGTTQSAVELKVLIEQMREQIQNIE